MSNEIRIRLEIESGENNAGSEYNKVFDEHSAVFAKIKESLSGPYAAQVELFTLKPLSREQLIALPGYSARLTVTNKVESSGSAKEETRYLCGVVSSVNFKGVILERGGAKHAAAADPSGTTPSHPTGHIPQGSTGHTPEGSWWYTVKLESPLEKLRHVIRSRSFPSGDIFSISQDLLKEAGLNVICDEHLLHSLDYDPQVIWTQAHESSYDFLHRLMVFYGVNYAYVHKKDFSPEVCLSRGSGAAVCRGASWEGAAEVLNTDAQAVLESYVAAEPESSGDCICVTQFHAVSCDRTREQDLDVAEDAFLSTRMDGGVSAAHDRMLISQSLKARNRHSGLEYSGSCESLKCCPGAMLKIAVFNDLKKDRKPSVSALIHSSECTVQATSVDLGRCLSPEFAADEPYVKTVFSASDIDVNDHFYEPGDTLLGSYAALPAVNAASGKNRDNSFETAVVCDASGATGAAGGVIICKMDDTEKPCMFYALIEGSDKPVVACLTSGNAGAGNQNVPAFPVVGQRVLLLRSGSRYFLHSLLPENNASTIYDPDEREMYVAGRTLAAHNQPKFVKVDSRPGSGETDPFKVKVPEERPYGDDAASAQFVTVKDLKKYIKFMILRGKMASAIAQCFDKNITNRKLTDDMTKRFTKEFAPRCQKAFQNCNTKHKDKAQADQALSDFWVKNQLNPVSDNDAELTKLKEDAQKKADALKTAYQDVDKLTDEMLQDKELHLNEGNSAFAEGLYRLISKGGIMMSAQTEGISLEAAKNISLKASQITLNADKIVLKGKALVNASVGGNSIGVARNAIAISSKKWSSTAGFLDSTIAVDSTTGVTATGVNVNLNSIMGTTMSDSLGGLVSAKGGSTTISGNSVSLASNTRTDALINFASFMSKFAAEVANIACMQTGHPQGANIANYAAYGLPAVFSLGQSVLDKGGMDLGDKGKLFGGNPVTESDAVQRAKEIIGWITFVLGKIIEIADKAVVAYVKASPSPAWVSKPVGENGLITPLDIYHICSLAVKINLQLVGWGLIINKMKWMRNVQQSLTGDTLGVSTKNRRVSSQKSEKVETPVSGVPVPNQPNNEKKPEETKPQETKPQETKPQETKPQETKPQETKPQETKPQETKPQETKPQETKPQETKPQETKPQETKPQETKPQETKPQETKPQETKPQETKPQETKPQETKPQETKPEEKSKSDGDTKEEK
jgi:hypothetical protein